MNRFKLISLGIFILLQLFVNAQSTDELINKFFRYTNAYQKDSLEILLTDDFELTRTYTSYKNDKTSFLNNYIDYSQLLKGKFTVIDISQSSEKSIYMAVDSSLYYTLLEIPNPIWKFSFTTKANQISKIQIDTTDTYTNYSLVLKDKNMHYENWLEQKYPNENQLNNNTLGKQYLEKLEEYINYHTRPRRFKIG